MVYTVTLNPALDRSLFVEKMVQGEANRICREERYAGGKGVDVSRVLLELGVESIMLGFVGGFTGSELEGRLFNAGLTPNFVHISSETRTNIIIHTEEYKDYIFNAPGPEIRANEIGEFYKNIKHLQRPPSFAILSGSTPRGISPHIYAQLTLVFEGYGARVVVDSSDEALKESLKATPFMIKPNLREFSELVGRKLETKEDVINEGKKIAGKDVALLIVSMKDDGAIAFWENKVYKITPPKVEVKNTIGAGDSLVAGVVKGLTSGYSMTDSLKLGVACGTATVTMTGTALANSDTTYDILPDVKLEELI